MYLISFWDDIVVNVIVSMQIMILFTNRQGGNIKFIMGGIRRNGVKKHVVRLMH